jgi:hypothetical protein
VFVSDLGSGYGTWVGGAPLAPGVEAPLAPGAWLRVGGVDLVLARGSALPAAAFQAKARLRVDAGPGFGSSITVSDRAVVGSANTATLSLAGLAPAHLEIAVNQGIFFARDLSGGGSFRSGSPVGNQWVELRSGETFLLGGATMLRFEELP